MASKRVRAVTEYHGLRQVTHTFGEDGAIALSPSDDR